MPKLTSTTALAALLATGTAAGTAASFPAVAQVSTEQVDMVKDSWIFVFHDGVGREGVDAAANRAVAAARGRRGHVYKNTIRGFSARMPAAAAARLAASNPNIAYYEADKIALPVMQPGGGGGGGSTSQTVPWGITRVGGGTTTSSASAWVLDTGVDLDHPDLNVDTARSVNFVSRGKNSPDDDDGHGTHVAGTIAAIDNSIGVVGVAPGTPVVGVRVLGKNGGTYADVIAGVDHVAANAAPGDVANMSLGGPQSDALDAAVEAAASNGIFFTIAAGNSGVDARTASPANAEGPNIWTVSASDINDVMPSWSNWGGPSVGVVDCAAPGVGVLSTVPGGYATYSGTSMAAPHVAGILLFGTPSFNGQVSNDPDGDPDSICVM